MRPTAGATCPGKCRALNVAGRFLFCPVLSQTGTRRRMVATLRVERVEATVSELIHVDGHTARKDTRVCAHVVVVVVVVHVETRSEEAGSNKVVWPAA